METDIVRMIKQKKQASEHSKTFLSPQWVIMLANLVAPDQTVEHAQRTNRWAISSMYAMHMYVIMHMNVIMRPFNVLYSMINEGWDPCPVPRVIWDFSDA